MCEPHMRRLAVEVTVEVEQVGLEQRVIGMLVERRSASEVDRTQVDLAIGALVKAGVHAIGRDTDLVGDLDVGRRETEQTAALIALDDLATRLERMADHLGGKLDLATGECPTDGRRTDRLFDPIRAGQESPRIHVEVVAQTEVVQQRDIAGALPAEMEVFTDHHGPGSEAMDEHSLDEVGCALERLCFVEAHDSGRVDPRCRKQFELLFEIGEQIRR